MRSKWVRYAAVVLAVALVGALVAGCSGGSTTTETTTGGEKTAIKAAMVTDIGGLGDKSFNDLSNAGLERAKEEFGVETKVLESKAPTDYESNLTQLANAGYNPIFAVGFLMTDTVTKVSTSTPDVTWSRESYGSRMTSASRTICRSAGPDRYCASKRTIDVRSSSWVIPTRRSR